jgi:DNA-directed RNA polymerase specialized sigma24 family protein
MHCQRSHIEQALHQAFLTATLLTANLGRAENAVTETIRLRNPGESLDPLLFRQAIKASTEGERDTAAEDLGEVLAAVPEELRGVVRLPEPLRHCFVLRMLSGLSREKCAELLDRTISEIDAYTCSAIENLSYSLVPLAV